MRINFSKSLNKMTTQLSKSIKKYDFQIENYSFTNFSKVIFLPMSLPAS